jgi:PAS domain S-box-containing protein
MRAFYEKHKAAGLEFRNLKTLFGEALVSGEPVISNQPAVDPRRGGLPPGHPPLHAYLGVPIWKADEMIAMVGIANRLGGYDMDLVREIEPLLSTYATIIRGFQVEKEQQAYREKIESLNADLEQRAHQLARALETNIRVERERLEALQEHSATLERRVAERTAELEHSKQQFQDLFEFAPDALVLTDDEGIIQLSNSITEQIFDWSRDELKGQSIEILISPELREEYWQARNMVIKTGQKVALRGRRKNAQDFPLELSISPVEMSGIRWIVTAMRDVSERTHLEQELVKISSREQERLAHELHDHLGAYLAGIALRFKTLSQLLDQRSVPEAEIALELVSQVNDAINQVRDFARLLAPVDLETGGLSVGLSQLSREMTSVFHIECKAYVTDDLPPLSRDQSLHLYRIAQEAARNAIHHGKSTSVEIRLQLETDRLILSITNDGKPWTPDIRQTQGMGLRIMRHRALSLGGQLTIHGSEQGQTTISCRIPIFR